MGHRELRERVAEEARLAETLRRTAAALTARIVAEARLTEERLRRIRLGWGREEPEEDHEHA
jgi:hypothetical protein